jgi:hypothetical protein
MTTIQNRPVRNLVLTIITGLLALAVTVFAVIVVTDVFLS